MEMKPRGSAPLASLSLKSIDASCSSSQTWYFSYSGRELVAKISCRTGRAGFPDPIQTTVIARLVFLHGCMWAPPKTELDEISAQDIRTDRRQRQSVRITFPPNTQHDS